MDEQIYLRRPNILPHKTSEYFYFLLISLMIPANYWFELWVVLPFVLSDHPILYWSVFILGHFILHNVVGNFLGILIFDTSIRGRKMPSEKEPGVKYCTVCDAYTPPRSYHCPSCDICILKRDHHCVFTNSCVGFYNHRFFVFFVFYVSLTTVGTLPLNIYFLLNIITIPDLYFIIKILFPFFMLLVGTGLENSLIDYIYLVIIFVDIYAAIFTLLWLYYHLNQILKGTVVYESKKRIDLYNLGTKKNLEMVFGKRWYLTFISPYIKSSLICDGIRFPVINKDKM